jgi:signal transduction histidine kinase
VILLDNALLALGDAKVKRLKITAAGTPDGVRITIEDSGPGIPAEILPRLFQPFVSGRPREGPRAGTGLGLAIARSVVERHHGVVTAGRSELGGAKLEIVLPRAQPVLQEG